MNNDTFVSTKSLDKKENYFIDLLKFVLCFFIIGIHSYYAIQNDYIEYALNEVIFRIAVPLYFFIAGYYLFSDTVFNKSKPSGPEAEKVKGYMGRILFMFVFWSAVYFPLQLIGWIKSGVDLKHQILIYIEYVLARGDSYKQLWYLAALLTAVFIIYILKRFLKTEAIFAVSAVCFVAGLLLQSYYCIISPLVKSNSLLSSVELLYNRFIGTPRSGLFFGFFFVAFGAFCAQKKRVVNYKISIIGLVLSSLLAIGEGVLLFYINPQHYCALQVSHIFVTYFTFSLCVNLQIKTNRTGGKSIRKMSSVIYCIHPFLIIVVTEVFKLSGLGILLNIPLLLFALVSLFSAFTAFLWIKLERKKGFGFLRKLH